MSHAAGTRLTVHLHAKEVKVVKAVGGVSLQMGNFCTTAPGLNCERRNLPGARFKVPPKQRSYSSTQRVLWEGLDKVVLCCLRGAEA